MLAAAAGGVPADVCIAGGRIIVVARRADPAQGAGHFRADAIPVTETRRFASSLEAASPARHASDGGFAGWMQCGQR
jgi:hypothetical protein